MIRVEDMRPEVGKSQVYTVPSVRVVQQDFPRRLEHGQGGLALVRRLLGLLRRVAAEHEVPDGRGGRVRPRYCV